MHGAGLTGMLATASGTLQQLAARMPVPRRLGGSDHLELPQIALHADPNARVPADAAASTIGNFSLGPRPGPELTGTGSGGPGPGQQPGGFKLELEVGSPVTVPAVPHGAAPSRGAERRALGRPATRTRPCVGPPGLGLGGPRQGRQRRRTGTLRLALGYPQAGTWVPVLLALSTQRNGDSSRFGGF
jgi:hypothetical protein